MKNRQHREEIGQFCCDFLKGNNKHLHNVIDNYRHLLAQINIQQMNLTQETFTRSFKSVCRELFNVRPTHNDYVIPLLGFALRLNEYHLSYYCSWYHVDMLIDSLADVLEDINFQPKELIDEPTYCMLL